MIIIIDKPGQLCNRLWAYSPFITFSIKNKISLRILDFYDYVHLFDGVNRYKNIKFGIFGNKQVDRFLIWILMKMIHYLNRHFNLKKINIFVFNKSTAEDWMPLLANKKNIIFLHSWAHLKESESLKEFKSVIINMFRPKKEYVLRVTEFVKDIRASFDVLVGVHIRRHDYKSFQGGAYWFPESVYLGYMIDLEKQLMEKGFNNVCFLLCSDSDIDLKIYSKVKARVLKSHSGIEDLYALSMCDYIFGPPSTFSMWASFYGEVPLRFIKYNNEKILLAEFSRIISQDVFENGTKLTHAVPR